MSTQESTRDAAPGTPSSTKGRWSPGRLILSGASALCLAGILLTSLRARIPEFRRFISAPVASGPRYTFVYPDTLYDVALNSTGAVVSKRSGSDTTFDRALNWLRIRPLSSQESIIVVITEDDPAIPGGRSDERWERGGEIRHNVALYDERTRRTVRLYHSCPPELRTQFERTDRRICDSFHLVSRWKALEDIGM